MPRTLTYLLLALVISLASACSSGFSDEDAQDLAISFYVDQQYEEMQGWDPNITRQSVRSAIRGAEVLSNDGITAVVRLEIKVRRDLPSDFVEIEVQAPSD